jgi:hypothetical protein
MAVDLTASPKTGTLYRAILWFNVAVMTLPIVYLPMSNGDITFALTYVIGAPLLVVASMFALGWMDGTKDAEDFS